MELTEIRISLCGAPGSRLRAFCSITFDDTFVIRDVKLIDGHEGLFLAMPSRKVTDHCPRCSEKNHLRARFCNGCGQRLNESRVSRSGLRPRLHADIAHPINAECRVRIEKRVLDEYEREVERSRQPGYVPTRVDIDDDGDYALSPRASWTAAPAASDPGSWRISPSPRGDAPARDVAAIR